MKFPTTVGACIDALYKLRQQRYAIERKAEALKKQENALENHIINTFKKSELDGARGKFAIAGIGQSTVPIVKDWDELYGFIKKHGAWDLLQRRVSATAYRERLEQKEVVPGVESFIVTKLYLRKR